MKSILLLAGVGLTGYGVFLLWKKSKEGDCGCGKTASSTAKIVKKSVQEIYPDQALKAFDTKWHTLFPTPVKIGSGAFPLDKNDPFTAVNFVR